MPIVSPWPFHNTQRNENHVCAEHIQLTHMYISNIAFGGEMFCSQTYCCKKIAESQHSGMWRKPHILSFLILADFNTKMEDLAQSSVWWRFDVLCPCHPLKIKPLMVINGLSWFFCRYIYLYLFDSKFEGCSCFVLYLYLHNSRHTEIWTTI